MDIIVSKVYDELRFAHFISIKYDYPFSYSNAIIDSINKYSPIKFYNLKECEVRYLQSMKYECSYDKPQICKLKIVNESINTKKMKIRISKVKLYLRLVKYLVTSRVSSDIPNAKSKIDNIDKEPLIMYVSEKELNKLNDLCVYEILDKENETKPCIDISPQPGDEQKQEPLDLFHVKFTKVVHYDEMLNERQIQALLKDNHVKSINIEK